MSDKSRDVVREGAFTPSRYMRARRPHLFSDTVRISEPILDKAFLEYQLETLTSRKQEQEFEEFCRRLAEAEICPNLKPQTGPTGGGDSQVDASTYPVAPVLGERCWWGSPASPSSDSWAFAFSCKKDWWSKVTSDVAKVSKLPHRFSKVYFITNQFTRDKTRAAKETSLGQQHGFELHILDRSWIVKTVIEHRREKIAFETLALAGVEKAVPQLGPNDLSRQQELDELLDRLRSPAQYDANDYALSLDYMNAAILSRGLEKPRHDIDGLFLRARELARKCGHPPLIIRTGYNHAWTSLWWFDDADALASIYAEIEGSLEGTPNAEDCELMGNLWRLLSGAVGHGALSAASAQVLERVAHIRRELIRLAHDTTRPNNALHAKTELHQLDLHQALFEPQKAEQAFAGLAKCLERSAGLGTYPAMKFIDNMTDAGEYFGHLPGYDALFEKMRRIASSRLGEAKEGKMLYQRGMLMIDQDRPLEALKYLGQARPKLFRLETMREGIRATLSCAYAYHALGLAWAARMDALTALHGSMSTPERLADFPVEAVLAATKLSWLELSLGRVQHFVIWHDLTAQLTAWLKIQQFNTAKPEEELLNQEGVLGCWFLNLDEERLKDWHDAPDWLEQSGLPMASWALHYALGHIDHISGEWQESATKIEDIEVFFRQWKQQPASGQLPKRLQPMSEEHQELEATLMGVKYAIKAENEFGPVVFAENLLGVIEAAMATADWRNLAFIVDQVDIIVDESGTGENPPPFELPPPPQSQVFHLKWKPKLLEWLNCASHDEVCSYFKKALLTLLLNTTIDPLKDLIEELDRLNSEDAFSRALGTSPISVQIVDILGRCRDGIAQKASATASSKVQRAGEPEPDLAEIRDDPQENPCTD